MQIDIIETASLGDRSYLVSADGTAVVVDPQRDIDRVQELAAARGVAITTGSRRTCTTTTSPAGWSWPGPSAASTSSRPATTCATSTGPPTTAR